LNLIHDSLSNIVRENLALLEVFIKQLLDLMVWNAKAEHVMLDGRQL
jgi:hypothetical protein